METKDHIFQNLKIVSDMKQVPVLKTHKYENHDKKFSPMGNLGPGICTFMHVTIYRILIKSDSS